MCVRVRKIKIRDNLYIHEYAWSLYTNNGIGVSFAAIDFTETFYKSCFR
jgi:hypothetical protein